MGSNTVMENNNSTSDFQATAKTSASIEDVKRDKLTFGTKISFGLGDWLNTMTYGLMAAFLMFFYSDIIIMPIAVVATIMSLSKFFDAITDPICGVLIDKTRSKHGVYRPWLIYSALPFALVAIAIFAPIAGWNYNAQIAYFTILYLIYTVVFTVYHIAYGALGGTMTQNPDDRGSLFGYRLGFSQAMFWLLSSTFIPLAGIISANGTAMHPQYGWFFAAAIFVLPGIIFAFTLFKKSKEVVQPPKTTKMPFKSMIQVVSKNPPLMMTMFGQLANGIYGMGRMTVQMYYFEHFVGNIALFSVFNLISIGCGIAGPFTAPLLQKWIGNKGWVVTIGAGISGIMMTLMFFISPATNLVLFFVLAAVAGYTMGLVSASLYACMLDTIELAQLNTGLRASAFIVSMCHFSNKVGMTISTAGVGGVLAVLGYTAGVQQSEAVLSGINIMFTVFPGIFSLIVAFVFLFYRLNRDRFYEVLQQLKDKEASQQQ